MGQSQWILQHYNSSETSYVSDDLDNWLQQQQLPWHLVGPKTTTATTALTLGRAQNNNSNNCPDTWSGPKQQQQQLPWHLVGPQTTTAATALTLGRAQNDESSACNLLHSNSINVTTATFWQHLLGILLIPGSDFTSYGVSFAWTLMTSIHYLVTQNLLAPLQRGRMAWHPCQMDDLCLTTCSIHDDENEWTCLNMLAYIHHCTWRRSTTYDGVIWSTRKHAMLHILSALIGLASPDYASFWPICRTWESIQSRWLLTGRNQLAKPTIATTAWALSYNSIDTWWHLKLRITILELYSYFSDCTRLSELISTIFLDASWVALLQGSAAMYFGLLRTNNLHLICAIHTAQSSITPGFQGMGLGLLQMHAWHTSLLPIYCNDYCLLVVLYFECDGRLIYCSFLMALTLSNSLFCPWLLMTFLAFQHLTTALLFLPPLHVIFRRRGEENCRLHSARTNFYSIWLPAFCFGDLGHALEILDFIIWRSWTCFGDFGLYHLEILDMLWRFWTLSFGDLGHALEILDFIMNGPHHDSPCFQIDGSHAFTMLDSGTYWRYVNAMALRYLWSLHFATDTKHTICTAIQTSQGLIQTNQLDFFWLCNHWRLETTCLLTTQFIETGDRLILCDNFAMKPIMDLMRHAWYAPVKMTLQVGCLEPLFLALGFPSCPTDTTSLQGIGWLWSTFSTSWMTLDQPLSHWLQQRCLSTLGSHCYSTAWLPFIELSILSFAITACRHDLLFPSTQLWMAPMMNLDIYLHDHDYYKTWTTWRLGQYHSTLHSNNLLYWCNLLSDGTRHFHTLAWNNTINSWTWRRYYWLLNDEHWIRYS